jgi:osmotically inducible protein OsmC
MPIRTADATWQGSVEKGSGTVRLGSGAFEGQYSFNSRFQDGTGTNPEELIGAAHAGCYSMALSAGLGQAGYEPQSITTTADVHITKTDSGWGIPQIDLRTQASVPGISESDFQRIAEQTKRMCPVSQLLQAAEITLDAKLAG